MEEANNFGLVQTIFTVPACHSLGIIQGDVVGKAALEIIWSYVKEEGKKDKLAKS